MLHHSRKLIPQTLQMGLYAYISDRICSYTYFTLLRDYGEMRIYMPYIILY